MIPKVCFSPMWFLKIITQLKFVYVYARVREYIPLRSVAYIIFQKTFFFTFWFYWQYLWRVWIILVTPAAIDLVQGT